MTLSPTVEQVMNGLLIVCLTAYTWWSTERGYGCNVPEVSIFRRKCGIRSKENAVGNFNLYVACT